MNPEIMRQAGFQKEVSLVAANVCPCCSRAVTPKDFLDDLSRKEFKISGLCQKCQDVVFGRNLI